ncbi:MAG: cysteine peptidase family C39 domain-containing protein [Planctomycetota bacterium]|jgi:hypothetical protein
MPFNVLMLQASVAGKADLWLAAAVMTAVSIGLFFLICRLVGKLSRRARLAFAAIVTAAIAVFSLLLLDSCRLLALLPFQAAIIYANFLLPLSAILAAVLWRTRTPAWRRLLLIFLCILLASRFAFGAITVQTPECIDSWDGSVCLQSSHSTCSAAAAATLLACHGIDTNEEEMARLCLTGKHGTYLHGLYRGLHIKTHRALLRVAVRSTDLAHLKSDVDLPVILNVRLTRKVARRDLRYARDWNWQIGVTHTVVLFGFTDDERVDIGEPGVGREFWHVQALRDLWHGEYICIERGK